MANPQPPSTANTPRSSTPTTAQQPQTSQNFSSLVSTILKTSGREPPPLVGSSTTVIGDTLYAFGGRLLSRTTPQLTCHMYALDLITRVWVRLDTKGDIPRPRYFHSMCALGDTKLVCFGGMSPATSQTGGPGGMGMAMNAPGGGGGASVSAGPDSQNEVMVMSDIHIFDIQTNTWTFIPAQDPPEGRYAHCATVLPTCATFTSANSVAAPVVGGLGLDSVGGAEMVVVGGQDSANHYIEEINVFNLRSLKWTSTRALDRSCGAYRSVVAPLGRGLTSSMIGAKGIEKGNDKGIEKPSSNGTYADNDPVVPGAPPVPTETNAMLIYSNYNFLDVKLELQIRLPDGSLTEKPMNGQYSPPGLRFPNGGVLDDHFVVSGTYLTSSKQEYALWALNLKTLIWSRIDAGQVFAQGSWNRGILWSKRNSFLILGNKSRSLVEDYNHRRINFTHVCVVELEAFGLYENPRMHSHPALQRAFSPEAQELGRLVFSMREMADMDFLSMSGERIPVNSRIISRRWGPYFLELLNASNKELPPSPGGQSRVHMSLSINQQHPMGKDLQLQPPSTTQFNPLDRPRILYLPHTQQTLLALVHFLYTSTLPSSAHPQSSPQVLASLLQIARPYRVEGLLEAVVERLHQALDGKNAAAVFNAAAMAAGGGAAIYGGLAAPRRNLDGFVGAEAIENAEAWRGGVSSVIGLQKRGLRGLMEGRRIRERARSMGGGRASEGAAMAQGIGAN
ncbi:uncharacterized protein LAJ45_11601 [Morchella importuna]|uniref:uncharacterized protein n=1 Tax=Morchella importuna TaxID=1174673 RepID=UPI001E8E1940|nr:uncharacterized protein LAJ45_11601 [Morchella importuna]KAH8144433.1 hypothetical protein LAJ45_11601 [Morchella importuna]